MLRHEYSRFALPEDAPGQQAIAEDFCLHLLQIRLQECNTSSTRDVSLTAFGLPAVQHEYEQHHNDGTNRLVREELGYQTADHEAQWNTLNAAQKIAAQAIYDAVNTQSGQLFFLDGYGGTGKTMLQNTVLKKVRNDDKIALAVASSGIASILLTGGRTAHSRFKIPLNANAMSSCAVSLSSDLAELFTKVELIFWDEISMQNRYDIEAVEPYATRRPTR